MVVGAVVAPGTIAPVFADVFVLAGTILSFEGRCMAVQLHLVTAPT